LHAQPPIQPRDDAGGYSFVVDGLGDERASSARVAISLPKQGRHEGPVLARFMFSHSSRPEGSFA
jgi:hypothetical protein